MIKITFCTEVLMEAHTPKAVKFCTEVLIEAHTPEALLDVVSLGITGSLSSSSLSERSSSHSSSDHGFLFFTFLAGPLAPGGFLCFGVPEDKKYIYKYQKFL